MRTTLVVGRQQYLIDAPKGKNMANKKKNRTSKKSKPSRKRKTVQKQHSGGVTNLISSALTSYEQGHTLKAKKTFLKVLAKQPANTNASYHLGVIAKEQGKFDEAIRQFENAISVDPDHVHSYFNLGGIYIDQEKHGKATEQFRKVLSLAPNYTNAYYNLGIVAGAQGRSDEAITYYEKVLALDPSYANAYYNIGWTLLSQGKNEESMEHFEKVLSLDPDHVGALFNLGSALQNKPDVAEAIKCYQQALAIQPDYYLAYNNLGIIYQSQCDFDKALECYQQAISINPEYPDAYMNMGNIYRDKGQVQETIEHYKKCISIQPSLIAYGNLCGYQKEQCNYDEVHEITLKMLEYSGLQQSQLASIHDSFIQLCEWEKATSVIKRFREAEHDEENKVVLAGSFMEFCAITDLSLDEISDLHKEWGRLTAQDAIPFEHENKVDSRNSGKKLRVGYISPDLREHSVGYLIKDIIASHNYDEFEVYCYGNFDSGDGDAFTHEITNSCTSFKYVKNLSDKDAAKEIFDDEIDILIDLAGHTAGHRLRVLAYKPAPIQITYLGYPNTTGLSRIDYRITDRFAESEKKNDYRYSEKLIRLTNCFLSFKGFADIVPAEIKDNRGEEIIFGCFNNVQKLTPKAVELWSRILKSVDNSTLHLKAKQLNTKIVWDNIVKEFAKHGISTDRVRCLGYTPTREEHLRLYNDIDISLDTFPYNGTVTTLEALWMNMPVITLVGESHAQRVSYSILRNLDLDKLIAYSEEEYVAIAIELAKKPEIIKELKTRMRKNLLASSICNPKVITREMELNFKRIWMEYLEAGVGNKAEASAKAEGEAKAEEGGGHPSLPRLRRIRRAGDENQKTSKDIEDQITAASKLRMAMVKLQAGEFVQALEMSSALVDLDGVSPLAWYVIGVSNYRLGQEERAIEALNKSIGLNGRNPGAWKVLGEVCLMRGEFSEANTCLQKVLELHSSESAAA